MSYSYKNYDVPRPLEGFNLFDILSDQYHKCSRVTCPDRACRSCILSCTCPSVFKELTKKLARLEVYDKKYIPEVVGDGEYDKFEELRKLASDESTTCARFKCIPGRMCSVCICGHDNRDQLKAYVALHGAAPNKYHGLIVPSIPDTSEFAKLPRERAFAGSCGYSSCWDINCSECLFYHERRNEFYSWFDATFKDKSSAQEGSNGTAVDSRYEGKTLLEQRFMGLFVPRGIDEDYVPRSPDDLKNRWAECCRNVDHDNSILCTGADGVVCKDCILSKRNAEIASKFFNCYKNKDEEKKMKNEIEFKAMPEIVTMPNGYYYHCRSGCASYAVELELKGTYAAYQLRDWLQEVNVDERWAVDKGCEHHIFGTDSTGKIRTIYIPYQCRYSATSALKFFTKLSSGVGLEVENFLKDTGACPTGSKFALQYKSMYDVWEAACEDEHIDYVSFMLEKMYNVPDLVTKYNCNKYNVNAMVALATIPNASLSATSKRLSKNTTVELRKMLNPFPKPGEK